MMSSTQPPSLPSQIPLLRPKHRELSDLTPGFLYITLYSREDDSLGKFHWAVYYHLNAQIGGTKYHIRGSIGRWMAAHEQAKGILKEFLLVGLVHVAVIDEGKNKVVDTLARVEDDTVNQIEGTTCHFWARRFCEGLRAARVMDFRSWKELEEELVTWGIENDESSLENVQPRPLSFSKVCGLSA
ncbi:hypothetical protein G7Y89_g3848 [Cudoniella acicularis]|uniref:Uncharacterized protein n=1 Tax=Cudoniella acicularis TaxID=354080 RepID=A0A8H4W4T8_9HELO|nr:hypothetical protein G7Y89_g3848 [Cudoniella acicularis]